MTWPWSYNMLLSICKAKNALTLRMGKEQGFRCFFIKDISLYYFLGKQTNLDGPQRETAVDTFEIKKTKQNWFNSI